MTDPTKHEARDEIASLFEHLLASRQASCAASAEARYKQIENAPSIIEAVFSLKEYDFEAFHAAFKAPHEELEEWLIEKFVGADPRIIFVFQQSVFIGSHLQNLFRVIEGNAYCVDKEGCVMTLYLRFLLTGKMIEFDRSKDYSFMYPVKILNDHDSVVDFMESLYFLFWGSPDKYLSQLNKIYSIPRY